MGEANVHDGNALFQYALENNCSEEMRDFLMKRFPDAVRTMRLPLRRGESQILFQAQSMNDTIVRLIRRGHRKSAAFFIANMIDSFHGFNYLHHQVRLNDRRVEIRSSH